MSDNFEDILSKIEELKVILESYDFSLPVPSDFDFTKVTRECVFKMIDNVVRIESEKESLKAFLDESDFWTAPASTKFHGNFKYGLSFHSIYVLKQALSFACPLLKNFQTCRFAKQFSITAEDIFISSLAHDFCKTDFYCIEYRNTKDITGNWVKKPMYKAKGDSRNLGHGNESVLKLIKIMPSYIDNRNVLEAVSMHMGFSDISESQTYNYSNFSQNPLVLLLQLADETAAAWFDC